jgi:hypothetical protein
VYLGAVALIGLGGSVLTRNGQGFNNNEWKFAQGRPSFGVQE